MCLICKKDHELNLGHSFSGEQLDDAFQGPLDVIRESARKMYISSSLFKPFSVAVEKGFSIMSEFAQHHFEKVDNIRMD